ncbi:MAG TPA: helix-turn-helix transcriptional regulator [Stenomitos sp.]
MARRLRDLRQAAGLTQLELATRAGISRAYLAALERGWSSATKAPPNPTRQVLSTLAHALGITVADLRGQQPTLPLPFQMPAPQPGLELLGSAPGAKSSNAEPWEWPAADGVVQVNPGVDEALGLMPGDWVLIRHLESGEVAEGLCLLEAAGTWSWGRIALIAQQPYVSAPDGSFRPMPKGMRAIARAIALTRPL